MYALGHSNAPSCGNLSTGEQTKHDHASASIFTSSSVTAPFFAFAPASFSQALSKAAFYPFHMMLGRPLPPHGARSILSLASFADILSSKDAYSFAIRFMAFSLDGTHLDLTVHPSGRDLPSFLSASSSIGCKMWCPLFLIWVWSVGSTLRQGQTASSLVFADQDGVESRAEIID
jgi:hypothetical protein